MKELLGHLWTMAPAFDRIRGRRDCCAIPLYRRILDPAVGSVGIRAFYHQIAGASSLAMIVHGIGGTADSTYCHEAAEAATRAGFSAVRVSLRGADGSGDDIHHAGLTDDLAALLSVRQLRRYHRVFLIGYSLGGLTALHAAAQRVDGRISGVVAICPPLDLRAAMENFDRKRFRLYKYVMNSQANRLYASVEDRGRACSKLEQVKRAPTCAAWNELTIVPRFGFQNAEDYYAAVDATRVWPRLNIPVLIVASRYDPIVCPGPMLRKLADAPPNVEVSWLATGGHISFPRSANVERKSMSWLQSQAGCESSLAEAG